LHLMNGADIIRAHDVKMSLIIKIYNFTVRLPDGRGIQVNRAIDIIDITIIAFLIYRVFLLLKGTIALKMTLGVFVILILRSSLICLPLKLPVGCLIILPVICFCPLLFYSSLRLEGGLP